MPRQTAAVQRHAGIHQRHMQRVPDQIIDQHRDPADSQSFIDKPHQFLRRQMVSEQGAAQQIETRVPKGKSESIACDGRVSVAQM